jgi:hypothetical protein
MAGVWVLERSAYTILKKPGQSLIKFPFKFDPMLKIAQIAEKKKVPLDLHADPISPYVKLIGNEVFSRISLLYKLFPNLRLIFSHTGMTNASNVRLLIETYPKLIMNLKIVVPGRKLK